MCLFTLLIASTTLQFVPGDSNNVKNDGTTAQMKTWDIVINEIMADPDPAAGSISYGEYVELYNKKQFPINLKNWKLCAGTNCKSLPDALIPADSFIVLTSSSAAGTFPKEVNVMGVSGFPAISNTGQTLQLLTDAGTIMSVVTYTDRWYQDALKKEGGYSLEQIDAWNPCAEMDNWRASINVNGGTPGKKNSVAAIYEDKQPPSIHRIQVVSPTQLEVYFTEAMDSTTLLNLNFYQITNIGNPIAIKLLKPVYNCVQLYLGTAIQQRTIYTLTIGIQITDCVGNGLEGNDARFAIPSEALPGDIVLNEVLFDPKESGVDFIEIYNRSTKIIDLKTIMTCHYDSVTKIISDPERITTNGYLLFPQEHLVLTEDAAIVKRQYATQAPKAFLEITDLPSLNADNGNIALKGANAVIDFFYYDQQMHFGLLHETKGISLERVNPEYPTNNRSNWHSAASSVGFATPGVQNSQFVGGIQTDKNFSVSPETFTPDNDGVNDQLNMYYQFDEPGWSANIFIYDLSGRLVRTIANNDLAKAEGSYAWDGTTEERSKAAVSMYLVYAKFFKLSGEIKVYKKVCVLTGKN